MTMNMYSKHPNTPGAEHLPQNETKGPPPQSMSYYSKNVDFEVCGAVGHVSVETEE